MLTAEKFLAPVTHIYISMVFTEVSFFFLLTKEQMMRMSSGKKHLIQNSDPMIHSGGKQEAAI